ncbi:MAG: hypothetical protein A3G34_09130 [Candidatus Lindowbacteria bacterium RIFCSPLOWO2_12_FULL_62_27]|nr:MAG: hypothetical protein A3I06_03690 [Candidatus Lindowbacteria bacterium RIFCSPLOWO2_02_FULL_62_12]OGH60151.1 MAG: hypothetical protein A3G34_09130 [Candidatus Lindowbacteria bacterium RIFCSPLOWO2_12_FULL_62_27]
MDRKTRDTIVSYVFLSPFLVVFGIFLLYPILYSLLLSFQKNTIYSDFYNVFADMKFVGFGNYAALLGDPEFWWSLLLTFYYAFLTIPAFIALSLLLALLLNNRLPGRGFFRSAFFLPNVLDMLVVGVIWTLIYAPTYGLLSVLGRALKIDVLAESALMSEPWTALPAVAFAMVLKGSGFGMILYLTAIQNIPTSIYEAAEFDGAGWWDKLRHITWPLVKPITLFLIVTGILGALNAFTEIYAMTSRGGPNVSVMGNTVGASRISGFYLYLQFEDGQYGYAAAVSYVLLVVAITVSIINVKIFQPKRIK